MDSRLMDSRLMEFRSTSDAPDSGVTILCYWVRPNLHNASLHSGIHVYMDIDDCSGGAIN